MLFMEGMSKKDFQLVNNRGVSWGGFGGPGQPGSLKEHQKGKGKKREKKKRKEREKKKGKKETKREKIGIST